MRARSVEVAFHHRVILPPNRAHGRIVALFCAVPIRARPSAARRPHAHGDLPTLVGVRRARSCSCCSGATGRSRSTRRPVARKRLCRRHAASAADAIALALASLREAAATRAFWALAGSLRVRGLSSTGIVQQRFIPFCADNNIGAVTAASTKALMDLFNFIGTIASAWRLADLAAIQHWRVAARLPAPPSRLRLGRDPRPCANLHARVPGGGRRLLGRLAR